MGAILDKIARLVGWLRAAENLYKWAPTLLTAALYGGTVIWAFITSVPLPLLVMNGITLLLVIVWLPFMPGLYRLLRAQTPSTAAKPSLPDYGVWEAMESYSIDQIAYLWIDRNPYGLHTPHEASEAEAIRAMLREAVTTRKLVLVPMQRENAYRSPDGATRILRASLVSYAEKFPNPPRFLKTHT